MTEVTRLFVITRDDAVVASHVLVEPAEPVAIQTMMAALPGQQEHRVDVPAELLGRDPLEILRVVHSDYRVHDGALVRKEG